MFDRLDPSSSHSNRATINEVEPLDAGQQSLRCQWCSVPLATGVTICPTCGSPGIPDPRMTVAGLNDAIDITQAPTHRTSAPVVGLNVDHEPVEYWNEDASIGDEAETPVQSIDFDAVEQRRLMSMILIGSSVLVCALLGWLIGPTLLQGPFESLTGSPVENPSDLRTTGMVGGLMIGMFIGATAGWVVWSTN